MVAISLDVCLQFRAENYTLYYTDCSSLQELSGFEQDQPVFKATPSTGYNSFVSLRAKN